MKFRAPIPIPEYMNREPTPEEIIQFRIEQAEKMERWYQENPTAKRPQGESHDAGEGNQ